MSRTGLSVKAVPRPFVPCPRERAVFLITLALFFVSGACGLLYQVVWTRKLVLLFGTTPYAVSTVLSIFFLGLGLGSLWGGRLADRSARHLRLFAVFETLIGVWAILFIFLIGYGESAVVALLRWFQHSHSLGLALRGLLAAVFLIVPVTLMGATLPLLARFVASRPAQRGLRIGALYGFNTFGAVAGCALTGFVLIENLGYTRATLLGAAANILVGAVAWAVSVAVERGAITPGAAPALRSEAGGARGRADGMDGVDKVDGGTGNRRRGRLRHDGPLTLVVAAFALSGFCFLALEVLWTRLLTIVFLGTTYAFTTMLTALLCGIAVGSLAGAGIADRARHRVSLFGILQTLMGIACIAILAVFAGLPTWLSQWQVDSGYRWAAIVQANFFLSFTALFVPTFLSGMAFPCAVRALTDGPGAVGRSVGRLYSANTLGGVLGALAGGYLIIPVLGTHRGIFVLATALALSGAVLILACPTRPRLMKGALLTLAVGLAFGAVRLAPADVSRAVNQWYIPADQSIIHFEEGVEGTVVVSAPNDDPSGSNRVLWINAVQATTSITKGVKMNRFQGVLPLVFNRNPLYAAGKDAGAPSGRYGVTSYRSTALFMCFGSGITAGTLGLSDFDRIDAVELSRAVLEAAPLFGVDNFNVLENPKLNFIVDDGRNFLLTTRNRYDVITFEPMPLAIAGVSTFYTEEYYRLCLDRLTPGGLVSQWVPLHSLSPDLVRSLTYTFTRVFPEYTAWFINSDLFLIGSNEPLRIDYPRVKELLSNPLLNRALQPVGLADGIELVNCFVMSKPAVDAYARGGSVMTDDLPWAEFEAPRLIYERNVPQALDQLLAHYESPAKLLDTSALPPDEAQAVTDAIERRHQSHAVVFQGVKQYYQGPTSDPETQFKRALEIDPADLTAQHYLAEITLARTKLFIRWDQKEDAVTALEEAVRYVPDNPELHLALADLFFDMKHADKALAHYQRYQALGGIKAYALERAQGDTKSM